MSHHQFTFGWEVNPFTRNEHVIVSENFFLFFTLLGFCLLLQHLVGKVWKVKYLPECLATMLFAMFVGGIVRLFKNHHGQFSPFVLGFSSDIFYFGLLPPIIFNCGYHLRRKLFYGNLGAVVALAFVGTFCATVLTSFGFRAIQMLDIGRDVHLTIMERAAFACVLSATDPVSTLAIFANLKVDPALYYAVLGESVLNDAVAITAFRISSRLIETTHLTYMDGVAAAVNFVVLVIGSSIIGYVVPILIAYLFRYVPFGKDKTVPISAVLCMVYMPFFLSEMLQLSGIVAIFFTGIASRRYIHKNLTLDVRKVATFVFHLMSHVSETCCFVLLGLSVFLVDFPLGKLPFMAAVLLACSLSRPLSVYPLIGLLNVYRRLTSSSHHITATTTTISPPAPPSRSSALSISSAAPAAASVPYNALASSECAMEMGVKSRDSGTHVRTKASGEHGRYDHPSCSSPDLPPSLPDDPATLFQSSSSPPSPPPQRRFSGSDSGSYTGANSGSHSGGAQRTALQGTPGQGQNLHGHGQGQGEGQSQQSQQSQRSQRSPVRPLPLTQPISLVNMHVIAFAGMRGAVAFSLAYIFPDDNGNRNLVLCTTIVVVLFTSFLQGCLTEPLIRYLGVLTDVNVKEYLQNRISPHSSSAEMERLMLYPLVLQPKTARYGREADFIGSYSPVCGPCQTQSTSLLAQVSVLSPSSSIVTGVSGSVGGGGGGGALTTSSQQGKDKDNYSGASEVSAVALMKGVLSLHNFYHHKYFPLPLHQYQHQQHVHPDTMSSGGGSLTSSQDHEERIRSLKIDSHSPLLPSLSPPLYPIGAGAGAAAYTRLQAAGAAFESVSAYGAQSDLRRLAAASGEVKYPSPMVRELKAIIAQRNSRGKISSSPPAFSGVNYPDAAVFNHLPANEKRTPNSSPSLVSFPGASPSQEDESPQQNKGKVHPELRVVDADGEEFVLADPPTLWVPPSSKDCATRRLLETQSGGTALLLAGAGDSRHVRFAESAVPTSLSANEGSTGNEGGDIVATAPMGRASSVGSAEPPERAVTTAAVVVEPVLLSTGQPSPSSILTPTPTPITPSSSSAEETLSDGDFCSLDSDNEPGAEGAEDVVC